MTPQFAAELLGTLKEKALGLDELHRALGVVDRGGDFPTMPNDACVLEKGVDFLLAETGDAVKVKAVEGLAKVLAFPQDRQPA